MRYLVRERIFGIGDDFWIEDEHGQRAFLVDGKPLRVRQTFQLKDPQGEITAVIRRKVFALRRTMTVERDGQILARVAKKRLTFLRDRFHVSLAGGEEVQVHGSVLDREYDITYGDALLARVSRKWFRLRDTYAVEIGRRDADVPMLLSLAVCIDALSRSEDD